MYVLETAELDIECILGAWWLQGGAQASQRLWY